MIEALGLTIIFFFALQSFIWFLVNVYLSLPINIYTLILTSLVSVLICYLLFFFRRRFSAIYYGINPKVLLPFLLLLAIVGLNLILNYYWPVSTEFNPVANYDYRARVFFNQSKITGLDHQYLISYPLFTSLGHTLMYVLGLANPKPFYSLLLWGFLLVFYSRLKQISSSPLAVLGCLLLITTPSVFRFASIAYTNFPYLVFIGSAMLYLIDYLRTFSPRNLLIFSLFIGFAAWVRPATHIFFLVNWLFLGVFLVKTKKSLTSLLIPLIIYLSIFIPWYYYQQYRNLIPTYEAVRLLQSLPIFIQSMTLMPYPLKIVMDTLFDLNNSGLVGIIFIYVTLRRFRLSLSLLVLIVNLLAWIILSLAIRAEFTNFSQWVSILYDSMRRLFIIFYPLIVYLIIAKIANNPYGNHHQTSK